MQVNVAPGVEVSPEYLTQEAPAASPLQTAIYSISAITGKLIISNRPQSRPKAGASNPDPHLQPENLLLQVRTEPQIYLNVGLVGSGF